MSLIELEPVDTDRDTGVPKMIHLVDGHDWEAGILVALCGTEIDADAKDLGDEPDCVVCVAEAERQGYVW